MLINLIHEVFEELRKRGRRELACVFMLLGSASCVPLNATPSQEMRADARAASLAAVRAADAPNPDFLETALEKIAPDAAVSINASIPLAHVPNPRALSVVFRGAGPLDHERALQCLAQAVYYEARSESEEGQQAVAQVVLNRVRHPSWPSTVCGVVYQGPMRAGGGCQFTFTCDGSLAAIPTGFGWARARRIAADALAGKVFAPVGYATHYHTHQVLPSWAYRLAKVAVIGSHNFYRIPDRWGTPGAFSQRYAAHEPSAATVIATRLPISPDAVPQVHAAAATAPYIPAVILPIDTPAPYLDNLPTAKPVDDTLPPSTIKEEYRNSGRWLDQPKAPVAAP
ncbi:cell wall hydrolase [Archangium sp.]|uniref:cell wall hydrolase n=1 Tax=Archangium sp. TaxID=1872627 RepID=UPI002ED8D58B